MTMSALVARAQPAFAAVQWEATEGRSWFWAFTLTGVDLTGVTGVCEVYSAIEGDLLLSPTVTLVDLGGNVWQVEVTATPAQTSGKAAVGSSPRLCPFRVTLTDGTDQADIFGMQTSRLSIHQGP